MLAINLLERPADLSVRHIEPLRKAVKCTRADRPFHIDAWVVFPHQMHCVITLLPDDVTLEQVYGALTFYLVNKSEVDAYLEQSDIEFEAMRKAGREQDPMFYQKLADARRRAA